MAPTSPELGGEPGALAARAGRLRRAAGAVGGRASDAASGLLGGARLTLRGVALTWRAAGLRCGRGLRRAGRGEVGAGSADLAAGVAQGILQAPADAALMLGGRLLSAIQTLAFLETTARRLTADEVALLGSVFAGGLDYGAVRLKEGRIGLLGLPHRAFTHGDTVFVPWRWKPEQAASRAALLVHEAVHVWQHQRRGTAYLSEALLAQWLGDGYNFATGLVAGRRWPELNPEQQAEMVERAFSAGYVGPTAVTGGRFLVKLLDRRSDHGFAVRVVAAAESLHGELLASGYVDHTAALDEALGLLRQPRAGASGRT